MVSVLGGTLGKRVRGGEEGRGHSLSPLLPSFSGLQRSLFSSPCSCLPKTVVGELPPSPPPFLTLM